MFCQITFLRDPTHATEPRIDWYREHPIEDNLKLLAWSDKHCNRQAYVDWKPFKHPQLGAVEIGGWDK